tara:strand:+ start:569 stop:700 length:132 start_codon:yes stop_codon:yes gene_type:complete
MEIIVSFIPMTLFLRFSFSFDIDLAWIVLPIDRIMNAGTTKIN